VASRRAGGTLPARASVKVGSATDEANTDAHVAAGRGSAGPRGAQTVERTATSAAATAAGAGAGAGAGAREGPGQKRVAKESSAEQKCTTAGGQVRVQSDFPRRGCTTRLCVLASPAVGDVEPPSLVWCLPGASSAGIPAHNKPAAGQRPGLCSPRRVPRHVPRARGSCRPTRSLQIATPFARPTRAAGLMLVTAAGALGATPVRAPGSRPARAARGSRGGRSTLQRPRLRLSTPAAEGLERGSNGTQAGPRITRCAPPGGAGARTSASHAQQRPPQGAD
jgi:hypothetical protein